MSVYWIYYRQCVYTIYMTLESYPYSPASSEFFLYLDTEWKKRHVFQNPQNWQLAYLCIKKKQIIFHKIRMKIYNLEFSRL